MTSGKAPIPTDPLHEGEARPSPDRIRRSAHRAENQLSSLTHVKTHEEVAMIGFTVTDSACVDHDDAVAQIVERGWHPVGLDEAAGVKDWHWHDVDAVLFFLSGALTIEMEDGTILECRPFARLDAPREIVHRESSSSGYNVVIGISVPVSDLTYPIEKPVSERPHRARVA